MDISSTTFHRRRRSGSRVSCGTRSAPSCWATAPPPALSCEERYTDPVPMTQSTTRLVQTHKLGADMKSASEPVSSSRWAANIENTNRVIASTASTTATTARTNSQMSRRAVARALACRAKKFIARSGEAHLRHGALLGRFDLERLRGREAEHAGDHAVRKHLPRVVVAEDGIVVGLPCERDLVFGAGELFGELHHVLVGLEVGVGLRH